MNRNGKDNSLSAGSFALVRSVLDALDGVSWLVDADARVLAANHAAETLTAWQGRLPVLDGPKVRIDLTELIFSAVSENKAIDLPGLELHPFCANGNHRVRLRVVPLSPTENQSAVYLVHLADYAQSRELSIQNAENEKMTSLTGLAAKIAHELNNPLDGSMRYIKLAQRRLSQDQTSATPEKVSEYLSSAQEALGKINGILSDLTRFARHGQSNLEAISVGDLIEQAVRTLSARASLVGVSIVTSLADDLPRAGGTKLYQVFCNLLKNAIDAIVEKQRREPRSAGRITITSGLKNGAVQIRFEDNGVGLPAEREYLFDPFFSTKAPDEGTGLGLAISREIIQQYHGKITASDGKHGGARFLIELPPIDEVASNKEGR
jgi:signal transduction histidine kinase